MELHHIGYIVNTIEEGILHYKALQQPNTEISKIYEIPDQKVRVCFIPIKTGVFLELVEPLEGNNSLKKLKKKGVGFYHLGFFVDNIQQKILEFEQQNYRQISLFASAAFEGRLCAFLLSPDFQLVELIEAA